MRETMKKFKTGAQGEMPFLDHLEELRWRLLWSLLAVIAGALVGFVLVDRMNAMELLIAEIMKLVPEIPDTITCSDLVEHVCRRMFIHPRQNCEPDLERAA